MITSHAASIVNILKSFLKMHVSHLKILPKI